jgi:hypothetical protein
MAARMNFASKQLFILYFFLAISCSKKKNLKWIENICLVSFPGYYQTQEEEDKLPP